MKSPESDATKFRALEGRRISMLWSVALSGLEEFDNLSTTGGFSHWYLHNSSCRRHSRILAGGGGFAEPPETRPKDHPALKGRQTVLGLTPFQGWETNSAVPVVPQSLHHRLISDCASGTKSCVDTNGFLHRLISSGAENELLNAIETGMMNYAIEQLQRKLSEIADPDRDPQLHARFSALQIGELLYLDFQGSPFDESYDELCNTLILPDVASRLGSLSLRAPADEGANGTRNWNLAPLVDTQANFPNLRSFSIEQNRPGDHNRVIVAADYHEDSVLGRLLRKAPSLEALIVPSAPDAAFFALGSHPLRFLSVDAGYDTQNFIRNLADSSCFSRLETLEFGEFNEAYLDDFPSGCTPFDLHFVHF